ncbi:uncharacterized protein LOC134243211 [Saccostrea cucullata]|uniref:uncharacterized protein LOC134243211 n=1 Tax=Saccostrea cuccullata TaxID=36930 RepID=UPI002ED62F60
MKYGHERVSHLSNFLSSLGDKQGEQMPDRAKIMLPTCMTQKSAYKEYADDHETPFSYRHFQRVWKERCPDMKASERSAFTECKECSMFKQLKLSKLTKEQRVKLQQQKKAHLLMARIAREKYYKHSKKAADRPDKYLSIIIDNMDQAKTNLPRFPTYHKGDATLTRVHHHVTGVLEHGQKKPYLFTWTDKFPCDANITINCLLKVLEDVSNDMSLPPTLYIQADNSAKDNKNVILMGFLASLVQQRIVKKIKLSFLMVGHTHEDELFSRVSVHISRTPIQTLPVLQELSREAYNPTPHVEHLENIWDYRQLGLSSSVHLVGHSTPHVFKFTREGDQVFMSYKEWPLKSSPYKKVDVTGLASAFQEDPEAKTQMTEKGGRVFQAMDVDLQKWEDGGKLSSSDVEWWRQHLARERQFPAPTAKKASEFLHHSMGEDGPAVPLPAMQGLENHIRNLRRESTVKVVNRRSRD